VLLICAASSSLHCYRQVPVDSPHAETGAGRPPAEPTGGTAYADPTFSWEPGLTLNATTTHLSRRNDTKIGESTSTYTVRVTDATETSAAGDITIDVHPTPETTTAAQGSAPTGMLHVDRHGRLLKAQTPTLHEDHPTDSSSTPRWQTRRWWEAIVELWAGRRLVLSDAHTTQTEGTMRLPAVGRVHLPVETRLSADATNACVGQTSSGCLNIKLQKKPHVHELRDHLQGWVDRYADRLAARRQMAKAPGIDVTSVYARYDIELVTETDTLMPSTLRTKRLVRMSLRDASSDQTETWKFVETRRTVFRKGQSRPR
jgi:hypothetical protein